MIILVGISNSGKSSWAAKTVQRNPDKYIRINRDKLREMCFGYSEGNVNNYYYRSDLHHREKEVTVFEDLLIQFMLDSGKVPIIDATHLKPKYLNRFDKFSGEKEIIFFNTKLSEALIRNKGRERKVRERIIMAQYNNYVDLRKFLETQKLKYEYTSQEIYSND